MTDRSVLAWAFALVTASLVPACTASSPGASNPADSNDGSAPDNDSGGALASGGSSSGSSSHGGSSSGSNSNGGSSSGGSSSGGSSSSGSSSGGADAATTGKDAGNGEDAGPDEDGSTVAVDSGMCIRPPYQTTNECTGIGMPGGPVIPSCSRFNADGQLICPTIPNCTVVPDPTGKYCTGDGVTCGLSDCGHICILPNWNPCYDVASGECLEGC